LLDQPFHYDLLKLFVAANEFPIGFLVGAKGLSFDAGIPVLRLKSADLNTHQKPTVILGRNLNQCPPPNGLPSHHSSVGGMSRLGGLFKTVCGFDAAIVSVGVGDLEAIAR
jgi:hypothetical protein